MNFPSLQPLKAVLVAPVIVRYDAISATVYDTYRALDAEPDIQVTALTWRNDFPGIKSRIVGDVPDMLLEEDFLAADVILYHFGIYAALFDAMLVGNGQARQIVCFHNITPARFLGRQHHDVIKRSFRQLANLRYVDEIWAHSTVNAEELISRGIDPAKVRVVPLAVESPPIALLAEKETELIELLFVGRIISSKGVLDLVQAIQRMRQRTNVPFRLRIAGNREASDQVYLNQVESAITDARLSGIIEIVGTVDDATLERLYREAHVFVIPSYHEGFCKTAIEALRAGCVPVGYASYNLPHITNGFGRMVPPGDIESLASVLAEVIEDVARGLRAVETHELRVDCGTMSLAAFDAATKAYVQGFSLSRFCQTVATRVREICPDDARARSHRRKTFQEVYREKCWGTDGMSPFFSGVGSREKPALIYIDAMATTILTEMKNLQPSVTIVDLGCGDFSIGAQLLKRLPPVNYIGCDVVPELIEYNRKRYGSQCVQFQTLDIVSQDLPDGDICFVRQVFQHLPNRDIACVLPKLRKYRYVYVTEGQPILREGAVNPDKPADAEVRFDWRTGRGRGVELDQPPWNLAIEEVCRAPGPAHDKEIVITYRLRL